MNEQTTQAYIAPSVGRHKLESEIARLEAENAKLNIQISHMDHALSRCHMLLCHIRETGRATFGNDILELIESLIKLQTESGGES